jgi:hypothetical protein
MAGMDEQGLRRSWPRVTLVLPPEARDTLHQLARAHYRDPRREALRLLLDAIERERVAVGFAR